MLQSITEMLIALPAIVIALTFHEYAHGKTADLLGDSTPYYQGRLTLNPLPHIDWLGFLMLFIFQFGWAKPVQVNPFNFKKMGIKKGMMLVSLAGPGMNILLAFIGLLLYKFLLPVQGLEWGTVAINLVQPLISINLILAAFNLIPLPPLDGSKILAGLLPDEGAHLIYSLEQYGPLILLLLIITGIAGKIFLPLANMLYRLLLAIVF
ncbi:MAG: site-2 protease family protein [Syntrophomonas sp.]